MIFGIITAVLGIITAVLVLIHALAVWGGYKIVTQRSKLKREDMVGLGLITASGLLHIINYIL